MRDRRFTDAEKSGDIANAQFHIFESHEDFQPCGISQHAVDQDQPVQVLIRKNILAGLFDPIGMDYPDVAGPAHFLYAFRGG